jgi:predicted hydrocarbon binding protein
MCQENAMKLDELRKRLSIVPDPFDPQLLEDMNSQLKLLDSGDFIEHYTENVKMFDQGIPVRPNFPNKMQIMYMRDRQTFMFALMPELLPVAYHVGRMIGHFFDAPRREGITLKEALETGINVADFHEYGHQEVVTCGDDFAIYRTYECADCYGLPNIGMKICVYEIGVTSGAIERTMGRPVWGREVRCCANGDPYCEFELHVGTEPAA